MWMDRPSGSDHPVFMCPDESAFGKFGPDRLKLPKSPFSGSVCLVDANHTAVVCLRSDYYLETHFSEETRLDWSNRRCARRRRISTEKSASRHSSDISACVCAFDRLNGWPYLTILELWSSHDPEPKFVGEADVMRKCHYLPRGKRLSEAICRAGPTQYEIRTSDSGARTTSHKSVHGE